MPPLYIVEQGAKLRVEKRRLVVTCAEEMIIKVPFAHTNAIVIFGNTAITTPAMKRLMQAGVDVVFLTVHGRYEGRLVGAASAHGLLRQQQYDLLKPESARLPLAQRIVAGKCANMRTLLMRRHRQHPTMFLSERIDRILALKAQAGRTTRLNSLRGVEGAATAAYFQGMRTALNADWAFHTRNRRPPTDPVNVLLSFGYTLLTK